MVSGVTERNDEKKLSVPFWEQKKIGQIAGAKLKDLQH